MTYKNLGPNVSHGPQIVAPSGGRYTSEDHSFEALIFEANKPFTDWEMNLLQESMASQKSGQPSQWLSPDFLDTPGLEGAYGFIAADPGTGATANKFQILGSDVLVNGWPIRFDLTNGTTLGLNEIDAGTPPTGSGTTRIDLVILEVWRAIVAPSPSTVNKSPGHLIFRYGNAKALDSVNLADDIQDPAFASASPAILETTRRVQIQYRYRVIHGVSLGTYPNGLDDPSVVANTAAYLSASGPDGTASIYPYVPVAKDPGLWRAGVNSSTGSTALGSVDGFMYAVPICAVFRRNTAAFNRTSNLNGGSTIASGTSTRPDGLFSDQIVASDIKDLRKAVLPDLHEVLEKAAQQVFDNTLITEHELSSDGPAGTTFMARDNIGLSQHIGNTDGVRRWFGDRSITESITCRVTPDAPSDTFVFSLSALIPSWGGAPINILGLAPVGTNIAGVGKIRVLNGFVGTEKDALDGVTIALTKAVFSTVTGPGVDTLTITTDIAVAVGVYIYAEILIEYPGGNGLKRNVTSVTSIWADTLPVWADDGFTSPTSDSNRFALAQNFLWWQNPGHREVGISLLSLDIGPSFFTTTAINSIYLPEKLTGDTIRIDDSVNAPYNTTNYVVKDYFTIITLTGAVAIAASQPVQITYRSSRAVPAQSSAPHDSYQVFYQTRAIQSVAVPSGSQTLNLIPKAVPNNMFVITNGSGSPDRGFPFNNPSTQIPVGSVPSANYPDSRLDTPGSIGIAGTMMKSGFAATSNMVPYMPNSSAMTLYKNSPDSTQDGDGRNFWPKSDDGTGTPLPYSPVAFGQTLVAKQRHKIAIPMLVELKSDFPTLGRKGTQFMVIISRWAEYDDQNNVTLSSVAGDSCAAVYRIRGNLMNPRRTS